MGAFVPKFFEAERRCIDPQGCFCNRKGLFKLDLRGGEQENLPSALCPLPSALCPLPSAFCPLPSALCSRSTERCSAEAHPEALTSKLTPKSAFSHRQFNQESGSLARLGLTVKSATMLFNHNFVTDG
jgi:hypothetical protein